MADLLEQGSAFLEDQRHRHMTRTVVYRRGTDEVELSATIGRTVFEQADDRGLVSRIESRDFLVRAEDLVLAGVPALPKAGDHVREPRDGKTFVYEVMAPGTEPPFRYSDPHRRTLRIHTKHVGTESPPEVTAVPLGTWRLWAPSDQAAVSEANPCGFHAPLVDKGWDRAWQEGLWGEPSLDAVLPRYPNFCIMWAHGQHRNGQEPLSGNYPASAGGGQIRCTPRGPQDLAIAEATVPGFWDALAPRTAHSHSLGGRVMVYYGTPALDIFPIEIDPEERDAILDAMILPAKEAGLGSGDYIGLDACAACSQATKTQAMHFAERVLFHGIGICTEAHEQVHPELYPWHDGRFAALSGRFRDKQYSRWDLAATSKGWFGPGANYAIREHFCVLQGGSEDPAHGGTKADRLRLIVSGLVNGSPCHTILEMSDLPPAWLS